VRLRNKGTTLTYPRAVNVYNYNGVDAHKRVFRFLGNLQQ